MDGQWPQQHSNNVQDELDLTIGSPGGDFNQILQELGNDLDGMLALGGSNASVGSNGEAGASAAAAEQDSNGSQRTRWNRQRRDRDQVSQLEFAYRQTPHPDENRRRDLASRLGISEEQVKFWFQNRRSSQKTHKQRDELRKLKELNESLRAERRALLSATMNRSCVSCKGPRARAMLSENASLRDKLQHATAFLNRVSGGRASELMAASAVPSGSHGPAATDHHNVDKGKAVATDHAPSSHPAAPVMPMPAANGGRSQHDTRTILIDVADRATHEFMTLVYSGATMWVPAPDGEVDLLNFKNYIGTMFPSFFGPYRMGVVVDGTRKAGDVRCTANSLIGVLMDAAGWSGMFPGIVARATASHLLTPTGSPNGMTILMDAELRVLSPQVPIRRVKFVRQCRKQEQVAGTWTVVDASVDGIIGEDTATCRLLPSGCLIQEMTNGCCKVTWIVNMEHDETTLSEMYRPFIRSGQALGACRWLASLQRQCEYIPIMHSIRNTADMTPNGKMNILEVAQQMTRSFCKAMCGPWCQPMRSVGKWSGSCGVGVERFEVVARAVTYSAGSAAPGALVLSVTAPLWLPGIPPQQVFAYLCNESRRREWDSLGNGAPILQEGYFATAQLPGNAVSVLRTTANGKLILQEACADATCMVLAYAATDEQRMQHAMNNGGAASASVSLLPSGVAILPDGGSPFSAACTSSSTSISQTSNTGSLVTIMYQTLLNGQAPNEPSIEAIDDVGNLICRVIRKIKDAVHANSVVAV